MGITGELVKSVFSRSRSFGTQESCVSPVNTFYSVILWFRLDKIDFFLFKPGKEQCGGEEKMESEIIPVW